MRDPSGYQALDDLEKDNVRYSSRPSDRWRLEYVLETLDDANKLASELDWQSTVWKNCTVEELLGALIEAELLLEAENEREQGEW